MKIKVCGITSLSQLQQLQQLGIDYAGMIFYEGSKRFAGEKLNKEASLVKAMDIFKVGVFVNAAEQLIQEHVTAYGLNAVQLHGDESPELCSRLSQVTTVIKAMAVGDGNKVEQHLDAYKDAVDYFLFDTQDPGFGGSGRSFNWSVLENASIPKPFFLSGGIGPADVAKIRSFSHPMLHGVDVNSRFETGPGIKNMEAVHQFKQNLHGTGSVQ